MIIYMLSHEKTIEEIREGWRKSSKKSYDANKIKAARKRIMLNIIIKCQISYSGMLKELQMSQWEFMIQAHVLSQGVLRLF